MKKALFLTAMTVALLPGIAAAQSGIGVAAKAGSIGVGLEAALGLGSSFALRGGAALMPASFDRTYSDIEYDFELPDSYMNIGLDFYPGGGPFRVSGGVLIKPDEPTIRGSFTEPQDIGGRSYTPEQIGSIVGEIDSGNTAPFVTVGLGRHTTTGFGLFLDVGLAFLKDPTLSIRQEGGSLTAAQRAEFNQRLEAERQDIEDELGGWQKFYPIVQAGVKLGLGG